MGHDQSDPPKLEEQLMKEDKIKIHAPYGKVYVVSVCLIMLAWEFYIQSQHRVEYPIYIRLRALISSLLLATIPVIALWIQDTIFNWKANRGSHDVLPTQKFGRRW